MLLTAKRKSTSKGLEYIGQRMFPNAGGGGEGEGKVLWTQNVEYQCGGMKDQDDWNKFIKFW